MSPGCIVMLEEEGAACRAYARVIATAHEGGEAEGSGGSTRGTKSAAVEAASVHRICAPMQSVYIREEARAPHADA